MTEPWFKYRPLFDTPTRPQDTDAEPFDVDALIAFMNEALGHEYLAGVRAKYSSGNPDDYEKAKAAAQQNARADAVLANIGPSTPFVANLTVALYADDFSHASRAVVALVRLVRGGSVGEGSAEWRSSDVERTIRDYLASLPKAGAHRRKLRFSFASPAPLTNTQLRLLQHSRNGDKLATFAASEGMTAPWATKQRVWTIYAAVAYDVPLPPTLVDFRRGVWAGPTGISEDSAATVAAVLKRATKRLLPLIADARERIEPERAVEVAQVVHAAKVKAGKAAAAARVAKRAAEKPPLTKEEREARADAAMQRALEKTAQKAARRRESTS